MYRLPTDFNGNVLIGRTVEQICFTENQVSLAFDGATRITVEGGLMYKHFNAESAHEVRPPVDQSTLMRLLGKSVAEASTNGGALTLVLSNRDTVTILDDSENYESYEIQIGDTVIIV